MQKILHIDNRKNIFWTATVVIGVCVSLYIYCVTTTIRNIVTEKQLSNHLSNMNQKISVKEFDLINDKSKITLDYARSLGFAEAKQKVFITPKSVSYVSSDALNNGTI